MFVMRLSFLLLSAAPIARAALTLTGSSLDWTPMGANFDFFADQQTGSAAGDIVGDAHNVGFLTKFDDAGTASKTDGTLGFRVRLDDHGGQEKSPSFDRVLWIGMDADLDGTLDGFLGVDRQGSTNELAIYAPSTGANTSPSNTKIAKTAYWSTTITSTNYHYRAVDVSLDGGTTNDLTADSLGDPDFYVSFSVAVSDLVSYFSSLDNPISFNQDTPLRYVLATSTQKNSLNQDLGGIQGGNSSTQTWTQLGGFTPTITADGAIVPESNIAVFLIGVLGFLLRRCR